MCLWDATFWEICFLLLSTRVDVGFSFLPFFGWDTQIAQLQCCPKPRDILCIYRWTECITNLSVSRNWLGITWNRPWFISIIGGHKRLKCKYVTLSWWRRMLITNVRNASYIAHAVDNTGSCTWPTNVKCSWSIIPWETWFLGPFGNS